MLLLVLDGGRSDIGIGLRRAGIHQQLRQGVFTGQRALLRVEAQLGLSADIVTIACIVMAGAKVVRNRTCD